MFHKEEPIKRESYIKDFDEWINKKLVEDREILDALEKK